MIRSPAVAGSFYDSDPEKLRTELAEFLQPGGSPQKPALGLVVPHAGYMYSGRVAGATFSRVEIPPQAIVLCPNHTGLGARVSINARGVWRTPLGDVAVDETLARRFMENFPMAEEDALAHLREHALEVELPFLQARRPEVRFVPLCLAHLGYEECVALGRALAETIRSSPSPTLLVASSDMNHYESQERTLAKDQRALDAILALDPRELYRRVHEESISMCGVIPTTCMLLAVRSLGASQVELVQHATSGDVNGDYSGVVGYAGLIVS